jgi:Flp pilus assembly protein TadB
VDAGIITALGDILVIVLMVAGLVAPVVFFVGLIWLAVRHLRGKRTRFDGLFGGIGRAAQVNSHLQAGTPHPDDLAVPVPPRPRHPPRDA